MFGYFQKNFDDDIGKNQILSILFVIVIYFPTSLQPLSMMSFYPFCVHLLLQAAAMSQCNSSDTVL